MNSVVKMAATSALAIGLIACGGDIKDNTTAPQNYHDITVDLQGTVFDAVTGQRISTDGLKVTLVQGDNYRTAKTNGDFQGDYFIGNIPASANLGNITYRIIAEKDGYQTIESTYQPSALVVTAADRLQDRKVAELGNFYMYPNGAAVHDLSVKVFYNGQPVNGATITLQPQTTATTAITSTTGVGTTVFTQNAGFKAAPVSTTNANGLATFPASSLVLGASYRFTALPTKHNGYDLVLTNGATVTAGTGTGTSASQTTLVMDRVASFADNLYIEDVSNLLSGSVQPNGNLVITLNRSDVTYVGTANLSAALTNASTATLDSGAVKATATPSVVAGKTVITVSPVWGNSPLQYNGSNGGTADNNLTITYSGRVLVQINGKNALYDIFDLTGPTGLPVDKTVQVTTAF